MASRKEQKEKLRQERLEREAAQAQAQARRRRMGYVVAGILVAAVVVALVVVVGAGGGDGDGGGGGQNASAEWPDGTIPERKTTDLDAAVKAAGCELTNPKLEGDDHTTETVRYRTSPPTSGNHDPQWSSDRAYLESPRVEQHVHALEHGRVIYWFRPNAPANVRGALKELYDEEDALVVLTPFAREMPYQVAATAWRRHLGCPTYNDKVPDAFRAFRDAFRLKGPEYVPTPQ